MMAPWRTSYQCGRIVREAQRLARSGRHTDCTGIIRELEAVVGFDTARERLEDRALRALRAQLDRLCAMARAGTTATARRA
jgi:hypothetical protein